MRNPSRASSFPTAAASLVGPSSTASEGWWHILLTAPIDSPDHARALQLLAESAPPHAFDMDGRLWFSTPMPTTASPPQQFYLPVVLITLLLTYLVLSLITFSMPLTLGFLIAYITLLALAGFLAVVGQRGWYDEICVDIETHRRSYWSAGRSYALLRAHDYSGQGREAPFTSLDAQLHEAVAEVGKELGELWQKFDLEPNQLLQQREWWSVVTLCNILIPVVHQRLRGQLKVCDQRQQRLIELLYQAETLHDKIRNVWAGVEKKLVALAPQVEELKKMAGQVREGSPTGFEPFERELSALAGTLGRSRRFCELYRDDPDAPQTWQLLSMANGFAVSLPAQHSDLAGRLRILADGRASYLLALRESEAVWSELRDTIKAEAVARPRVATHRYVTALRRALAQMAPHRGLSGPLERYRQAVDKLGQVRRTLDAELKQVRAKRTGLEQVRELARQFSLAEQDLERTKRHSDGLEGFDAESRAVKHYLYLCYQMLCNGVDDSWERETTDLQLERYVRAPLRRISQELAEIAGQRAERVQCFQQVARDLIALEATIDAAAGRSPPVGTVSFRATRKVVYTALTAERQRGTLALYREQTARARDWSRELAEARSLLIEKGERLAGLAVYEGELASRLQRRAGLGAVLPGQEGWEVLDGELRQVSDRLALLSAILSGRAEPLRQPSALPDHGAGWRAETIAEALVETISRPLAAVDEMLAQIERDYQHFRKRLGQAVKTLGHLERGLQAARQAPILAPLPAGAQLNHRTTLNTEEFAGWLKEARAGLADLEREAASPAACLRVTARLERQARQGRRQQTLLRHKRGLLENLRALDRDYADLVERIDAAKRRIPNGLEVVIGPRSPIEDLLIQHDALLTLPGGDWQPLSATGLDGLAGQIRERRRRLRDVQQQWQELDGLIQQAGSEVDGFCKKLERPPAGERRVSVEEFLVRARWQGELDEIRRQFDQAPPSEYDSLGRKLDELCGRVAAAGRRLELKNACADRLWARLTDDTERSIEALRRAMEAPEAAALSQLLAETRAALQRTREEIAKKLKLLGDPTEGDWSREITDEWIEQIDRARDDIYGDLENARNFYGQVQAAAGQAKAACEKIERWIDRWRDSSITFADVSRGVITLKGRLASANNFSQELCRQYVKLAILRGNALTNEYEQIEAEAARLCEVAEKRYEMVVSVRRECMYLKEELDQLKEQLVSDAQERQIEFRTLKERILKLQSFVRSQQLLAEKSTDNIEIAKIKSSLEATRGGPSSASAGAPPLIWLGDSIRQLRTNRDELLQSLKQLRSYEGLPETLNQLYKTLREHSMGREYSDIERIRTDLQACRINRQPDLAKPYQKRDDDEVANVLLTVERLAAALIPILGNLHNEVAERQEQEWDSDPRFMADSQFTPAEWAALHPFYHQVMAALQLAGSYLQTLRMAVGGEQLKGLINALIVAYSNYGRLRQAVNGLRDLDDQIDAGITAIEDALPDLVGKVRPAAEERRATAKAIDDWVVVAAALRDVLDELRSYQPLITKVTTYGGGVAAPREAVHARRSPPDSEEWRCPR